MLERDDARDLPVDAEPVPAEQEWLARAEAIEQRIGDAVRAIDELRELLRALTPAFRQVGALDAALRALGKPPPARARLLVANDGPSHAQAAPSQPATVEPPPAAARPGAPADDEPFATAPTAPSEEEDAELAELRRVVEEAKREARGFRALPRTYLLTFEDRTRSVDLVPVNRALSSLETLTEVSLQRYSEGKAMVSVRCEGELRLPDLEQAVQEAMGRPCAAEAIDEFHVMVSLLEEQGAP